jgi:hypothetical protein
VLTRAQSTEIGYTLALSGAASIATQALLLPPLLRRGRPARVYARCMQLWPPAFVAVPALGALARHPHALWAAVGALTLWTRVACLAYSCAPSASRMSGC